MQALVYTLSALAATATPESGKPADMVIQQQIPGTSLQLVLVPMPVPDGSPTVWVSRDEISWDLYDTLVYQLDRTDTTAPEDGGITRPTKPYLMADRGWGHAGYPALSVSHRGAEAFCAWLSAKTGKHWRLPTVAEWTRLCETSGLSSTTMDEHAWHKPNAKRKTQKIGTRKADANGLRDLQGNVAEWCTTPDGSWVLMGASFRDDATSMPCDATKTPLPEWNDTDPQIPKSIWWLSDAPFAGFRVMCDETTPAAQPEEDVNDE
ncbi:MAG: SUMF1/EgtB/PvdO family nonheme iron enzyme [Phycisphaerales bacterium]|jgi:hypothetical protein|nr:SUMF1/EgtB/PvdO family nonheme iron enzyme [Phycisphaerales bacterium]MDP7086741.1 SUMF1/EgtB/PvdO family nonheme iron enzyme [Phycisphaerales bacterium]MDP7188672.1 SUMF1/EgtB/PvdO family nonheme iron enzyme [Phycisphaerales bacterium]HJN79505.1 SUMF1/EgtB/PvdO family nonheme iron enzyme [Phycisphaerales bacterium]